MTDPVMAVTTRYRVVRICVRCSWHSSPGERPRSCGGCGALMVGELPQ